MSEPDTVDMHGAAAEAGVHYDTFRKHWRSMVAEVGLPPPFKRPAPGMRGTYAWRRTALTAWKQHREQTLGAGHAAPELHNGGQVKRIESYRTDPRLKRDRGELARLMGGGR